MKLRIIKKDKLFYCQIFDIFKGCSGEWSYYGGIGFTNLKETEERIKKIIQTLKKYPVDEIVKQYET